MALSFSDPIQGAWARMKRALFDPFSLDAWLSIGLAAFLIELTSGFGNGFGASRNFADGALRTKLPDLTTGTGGDAAIGGAISGARDTVMHMLANPLVALAIMAAVVCIGALLILVMYLSARAEFVLFDQVANGHSRFREPWARAAKAGRSLFLFRAALSFAWLPALIAVALVMFGPVRTAFEGGEFALPAIGALVGVALICFVMWLVIGFVHVCTRDFVVPLMAVHDESVTQAWSRFGPLLSAHPGDFVAYALMLFLLELLAGLAMLAAGLLTCCVGLVIMMLPYIGAVVRLPIAYTRRGIGPLFLQQYGPEWRVMQDLDAAPEAPTPPPTAAY